MNNLLVFLQVEDALVRNMVGETVTGQGHRLFSFRTCDDVLSAIQHGNIPDILLLESSGISSAERDLYAALLHSNPSIKPCVLTKPGEGRQAAWLAGIEDLSILSRPVLRSDIEVLLEAVERKQAAAGELVALSRKAPRVELVRSERHGMVCRPSLPCTPMEPLVVELDDHRFFLALSPAMLEIYRQVRLLEGINASVLILGESGTGKEIVAHLIHKHSSRAHQKMVNVNCAALPSELVESELFGHVKGAFTGAVSDKPGRFEQANGGTILLDEVGEISVSMQAKLLHVLQDGQFTRLGARQPTHVDVHVLAATNISMERALAEKTFREDLYYRLNTFTIQVPPLRERLVEIPHLVRQMIARSPVAQNYGVSGFSQEFMEMLCQYSWPGNLRELWNFLIRTMIMQDERLAMQDLEMKVNVAQQQIRRKATVETFPAAMPMRSMVRDVRDKTETRMIEEALHACRWNRREAAQVLNISYRALLYKIQQYGLNQPAQQIRGRVSA